jgi:hypothetical protein
MLSPRLTNCPECANIPSLLKKIDCKLAELGNNLYNNVSYMLNKPVPANDILQLIGYRRILTHKYCNPNYVHEYSVAMIASRVIRLTLGCVSRCNEPERCLEDPCDIDIVPNPTTTSTSTLAPITTTTSTSSTSTSTTSTTAVPTTTTTTTISVSSWLIGTTGWTNSTEACLNGLGITMTVYTSVSNIMSITNFYTNLELTNPYPGNNFYFTFASTSSPGNIFVTQVSNTGEILIVPQSCVGFTTTTTTSSSSTTTTTTTAMVLPSVTVCGRIVTSENSNLTVLSDGTPIVYAANITEWNNCVTSSIPCYTYWQFDPAEAYRGCLYNQVAINNLAPPGWRGLTTDDVQYFYDCNPYLPVENLYAASPGNWDPTFWTDQSNAGETGIDFQGYGSPLWNAGNILWNGDGRFEAHGYSPSTFPAYGCSVNTVVGYVSWGDYLGYTINDPLYARFIKL